MVFVPVARSSRELCGSALSPVARGAGRSRACKAVPRGGSRKGASPRAPRGCLAILGPAAPTGPCPLASSHLLVLPHAHFSPPRKAGKTFSKQLGGRAGWWWLRFPPPRTKTQGLCRSGSIRSKRERCLGALRPARALPTRPARGGSGPSPSPLAESLGNVWPSFLLVPQFGALVFSVCQ